MLLVVANSEVCLNDRELIRNSRLKVLYCFSSEFSKLASLYLMLYGRLHVDMSWAVGNPALKTPPDRLLKHSPDLDFISSLLALQCMH